jgi:hypothetical protein
MKEVTLQAVALDFGNPDQKKAVRQYTGEHPAGL